MLLYGEVYKDGMHIRQKPERRIEPLECRVIGKEIKLYLDFEKYIKWSFDISNDTNTLNAKNIRYDKIRVEDQDGRSQIVKVNGDGNNPALKKFLKEREKMIIDRLLNSQQLRGGYPLFSKDFYDRYIQLLESFKEELENRDDVYVSDDENKQNLTNSKDNVDFPDPSLFI